MATLTTSHKAVSLTAPQLQVLAAAAEREDGALTLPGKLKGRAAQLFVGALMEKGVAREIRAKPGMPAYRHDAEAGRSFALVITKLGRSTALAAAADIMLPAGEPKLSAADKLTNAGEDVLSAGRRGSVNSEGEHDGREVALSPARAGSPAKVITPAEATEPRRGSKLNEVIGLLSRETGAGVDELMALTGWLPHTTRAAMTSLRKRGYAVQREHRDGGSVYRIQVTSCAKAA